MIPYVILGVLLSVCILNGIFSSLYDHQWGELEDLLLGVIFVPCVVVIFLVASVIFSMTNQQLVLSDMSLSGLFDKNHIYMLLPSIGIAALILIPIKKFMDRRFAGKR